MQWMRVETLPEQRVDIEHAPDTPEVMRMLADLRRVYSSHRALAAVLGVPVATMRGWQDGRNLPKRCTVRAIWLTWALHFAPWKLRTSFDLITWGRYARRPKGEEAPKHSDPVK